ncbi:MAG: hypothetical protein ACRD72_24445 [Candidatus Angelobacter sp.]
MRKAELLAESDTIRGELQANWEKLQPAVSWVETGIGFIRTIKQFSTIAVPIVGIWVGRKGSARFGLWGKMNVGWRFFVAMAAALKIVRVNKN